MQAIRDPSTAGINPNYTNVVTDHPVSSRTQTPIKATLLINPMILRKKEKYSQLAMGHAVYGHHTVIIYNVHFSSENSSERIHMTLSIHCFTCVSPNFFLRDSSSPYFDIRIPHQAQTGRICSHHNLRNLCHLKWFIFNNIS